MLGLEGRGVRTFLRVLRKDRLLRGGERISDPMERSVTVFLYPLIVPYNLTTTTQVGLIAPFLTKVLSSKNGEMSRSGFGDATVFLKQLVLQVDRRADRFCSWHPACST